MSDRLDDPVHCPAPPPVDGEERSHSGSGAAEGEQL